MKPKRPVLNKIEDILLRQSKGKCQVCGNKIEHPAIIHGKIICQKCYERWKYKVIEISIETGEVSSQLLKNY